MRKDIFFNNNNNNIFYLKIITYIYTHNSYYY